MFKLKKIMAVLLAALMVASFAACGSKNADTAETGTVTEETAEKNTGKEIFSNMALTDMEGNEVDSSVFADNKLTMINVWATFCKPCVDEMPDLAELSKELSEEESGVQIIGLVGDLKDSNGEFMEGQEEAAKKIIEETGADYTHLVPEKNFVKFLSDSLPGVPGTFFVDSEGKFVGKMALGSRSKEEWREVINERLEMLEK